MVQEKFNGTLDVICETGFNHMHWIFQNCTMAAKLHSLHIIHGIRKISFKHEKIIEGGKKTKSKIVIKYKIGSVLYITKWKLICQKPHIEFA